MSFRVGMKVVCIAAFESEAFFPLINWPKKGAVYTIRELTIDGDGPGLRLHEVINQPIEHSNVQGLHEPAFARIRFRPITDRKTDISIFKEILDRETIRDPIISVGRTPVPHDTQRVRGRGLLSNRSGG